MAARGSIWGVCLAAAAAACGSPAPASMGAVSSTIAILQNGNVAVLNPDQGSVSFLDPGSLAVLGTTAVGGDPRALLQLQSGAIWVANHLGGAVAVLDPGTMALTNLFQPCPGPIALAEAPGGGWVAVSCEYGGEVVAVDPATLAVTPLASSLLRPHGLAVVGGSVAVAQFIGGAVAEIAENGSVDSISLVPTSAPYRPELTLMTANLEAAVVPAFGYLFVTHELVNHTGDSTDEQTADDYGTVLNGVPKINAAVTRLTLTGEALSAPADTPPVFSRFDGVAAHAVSGPTGAAGFGGHYLLVTNVSTNDVAVLDTDATDPNERLVATYEVGAGPAGVAVNAAGTVAYVDNAIDGSVSQLDLTQPLNGSAPDYPAVQTLARELPSPYSANAQAGRRLFYDATNPHVTPSRVVACATCHPGGNDDGLVWFIDTPTIPLKRRRTPNLANSHTGTAPYHWNGQFANMTDLVNATITDLMAGDDLLVDATTVQDFVDEMVPAPIAPPQDPVAVAQGEALFQSAALGCSGCHPGPLFTDDLEHAVLNPMSLDPDDVFTTANTPALHGLFYRAPFFHDGRSPSLEDLLTRPDASGHGNTAGLTQAQLGDLIAYLSSL